MVCIVIHLKKYLTLKLLLLCNGSTYQSTTCVNTRSIVNLNSRVLCHQDKIRRRAAAPQSAQVLRVGG